MNDVGKIKVILLFFVMIILSLTACNITNKDIGKTATSTEARKVVQTPEPSATIKPTIDGQSSNKLQDSAKTGTNNSSLSNQNSVNNFNEQTDFIITTNQLQLTYPFKLTKYTYTAGNDGGISFLDFDRPEAIKGGDAYARIGGVDTLGSPEAMGKYNHIYVLSKKVIAGKIPTYQYLLKRDPPKVEGFREQYSTESHVYLVMNATLVYDIWFRTDYLSEDELLHIAQTFKPVKS